MEIDNQALKYNKKDDKVSIEGLSYGSRGSRISTQCCIGLIIRSFFVKVNINYKEVTPGQLKKFATGKGNTSKDNIILPIYKRWGYEHDSDNVRDAYVLAQIARALKGHGELVKYQEEVIKELKK